MPSITVLRMGHRRGRDDRISTHVGLAARQFGADEIIYTGEHDRNMLESVNDLVDRWGGDFSAEYREAWRPIIDDFTGATVHLTMYGLPFQEHVNTVQADTGDDLLLVVGGEKVPSDVYDMVDYNLAVGHQPHSEVAAIAVFLYEYMGADVLDRTFPDADLEVVPRERGKKTRER